MNMQSSKIEKMVWVGDAGKPRDLAEVNCSFSLLSCMSFLNVVVKKKFGETRLKSKKTTHNEY